MYKSVIQTQKNFTPMNSDILRVTNQIQTQSSSSMLTDLNETMICEGNVHLFKNISFHSQGLLIQLKSRAILVTNVSPSLEKIFEERKIQFEHYILIKNVHKIDKSVLGESRDMMLVAKSILQAEQLFKFIENEKQSSNSLVIYLQEIQIFSSAQHLSKEIYDKILLDDQQAKEVWMEIPTCVSCLKLVEQEVTGISFRHRFRGDNEMKNTVCEVCWIRSKGQASCPECSQKQDNWVCMICSAIGCGRYKNADAYKHFTSTKHSLSLDLQTNRIWNYKQDCFSHKIMEKQEYMDLGENEKLFEDGKQKLENAFWKYCCVVSEQLQKQRNFYQKIKQQEMEKLDEEEKALDQRLEELTKEREQKILINKRKIKKNKKIEKKVKQLEIKCEEEREISHNFEISAKSEFHQQNSEIEKKKKQLENLQNAINQILTNLG